MTKLESLIALRDAVKAGVIIGGMMRPIELHTDLFFKAMSGSLDAALALHNAVLPGWVGTFGTDGFAKVGKGGRGVQTVMHDQRIDENPARAWLIAILEALIAMESTK